MNNMKRLMSVAVLLVLSAGLMVGCSKSEDAMDTASPAPATAGDTTSAAPTAPKAGGTHSADLATAPAGVKTDLSGGRK